MKVSKAIKMTFFLIMIFLVSVLLTSCGGGGGDKKSSSKAITAFAISAPAASGIINEMDKTITVTVPYGTNLTNLVATFSTTGVSVRVGGTVQTSGVTANNFTNPVTYIVTAEDGTSVNYLVTVTCASIDSKEITGFAIISPVVALGSIDGTNISVTVPYSTDLTNLVADFSTTGVSVKVGATVQEGGVTPNDFTTPVTYTVTAYDDTTVDYTVTVTKASADAKEITTFIFFDFDPQIIGSINGTNISVTVPSETIINNLVADFITTGVSVKVGTTVQESGVTANDFTNPVIYTVTAYDTSTVNYTVTVTREASASTSTPVNVGGMLLDDFSSLTNNQYGKSDTSGNGSDGTLFVSRVTANARGGQGYSLGITYDVNAGWYYWEDALADTAMDLSAYNYVSFWVRGALGGEGFMVGLNAPNALVSVNDFLRNGITTEWQKVVIPFKALTNQNGSFSPNSVTKFHIEANNALPYGAKSGTIYIDDITFGKATAPIWIDNFNDGVNPNAFNGTNFGWGYTSISYEANADLEYKPYVENYNSTSTDGCAHLIPNGIDVSYCTDLVFDVRRVSGTFNPTIRIESSFGTSFQPPLSNYVTVTTAFQEVLIPVADIQTVGGNITAITEFDLNAEATASVMQFDNLRFEDNEVPALPTNMNYGSSPVVGGFTINGSAMLEVNAISTAVDPKMEGVRFEYSNDGGSTWVTIGYDYANTSKTTYSCVWHTLGLTSGAYQLRATAVHVGGTESNLVYNVTL